MFWVYHLVIRRFSIVKKSRMSEDIYCRLSLSLSCTWVEFITEAIWCDEVERERQMRETIFLVFLLFHKEKFHIELKTYLLFNFIVVCILQHVCCCFFKHYSIVVVLVWKVKEKIEKLSSLFLKELYMEESCILYLLLF